jgi:y4mF family transcriptional regulator
MSVLADFVKERRKLSKLTQQEFAEKAGVALTVIRKIEQGKDNLSLAKVNQVLNMFGHVLGPINAKNETSNY